MVRSLINGFIDYTWKFLANASTATAANTLHTVSSSLNRR